LNSGRNYNWLKWWIWKCKRFNSCQLWMWFKWDWWKWFTKCNAFRCKNLNIPWNQDWFQWWARKWSEEITGKWPLYSNKVDLINSNFEK
jgi:hypothetical protein